MKKLFQLLLASVVLPACVMSQENIDNTMMQKIIHEAFDNSHVMNIAFNLTDSSGPRLTGSPGFMRAANYAKQQLTQWGLVNVTLDEWGDFGKSWELEKSYAGMTAPYYRPINAYPKAWCSGTKGLQNADVILITAKDSAGLDAYRGKLAGKITVIDRDFIYHQSFTADAKRFTDAELDSMANIQAKEPDTASIAAKTKGVFTQQSTHVDGK